MKGKVKWFNNQKGYGFINPDNDENNDIFVHYTVLHQDGYKTLSAGEGVEFEVISNEKGDQARNVIKTSET